MLMSSSRIPKTPSRDKVGLKNGDPGALQFSAPFFIMDDPGDVPGEER
jgi:hypothetical protein